MENDMDDYVYHPNDDYYLPDDDHYLPESEDIAVSVLLLLGIFPILPALGWIILSFYRKRWDRKHASISFVFLLLADTLQLIVSPFIVETVLTGVPCWHANWWCTTVYILFSVSRFSGLFFHLMVALGKIISLRRDVSPKVFNGFIICSIPMMLFYTLFIFLVHVLDIYSFFYGVNTFLGVVALCIAAAACGLALKPLNSPTSKCQCLKVLAVAMFTFMILYVPEFLYWIIQHHRPAWTQGFSHVVHYLPCLRPITDCVLCWFVCVDGELPREQQPTDVELISRIPDSSHSVTSPSQNTLEEKDHGEGPSIREDARNQGKIH